MQGTIVNAEKQEFVTWNGESYQRLAIKTNVIQPNDDLRQAVTTYALPHIQAEDVLFISEKMVACTEGRAIPLKDIKPRRLARILSRLVYKNPHGIGLSMPETMEMALRECGIIRIMFAALCSAVGKILGKRGWFYKVAGYRAASIDGPCNYTLPPYNEYVVLGPKNPEATAKSLSNALGGIAVMIVDINDLGGQILGAAGLKLKKEDYLQILRDNPLGQTNEQTPMGIIRKAAATANQKL